MNFRLFLGELKKRNVVRVAGIYTVTAWGVFQVARTIFETFDMAKWVSAMTLLVLAGGLPVALLLSWAFEVGPDGVIRRSGVRVSEAPGTKRFDWMDWGAMAAIAAIVVVFLGTAAGLASSLKGDNGLRMGPASKSVAVLPFANFSSATDGEYFADGLTEEVTNSLAQVPDLKVAGRTSAFYFKGRNEDVREIGKKLNVAHVVEGSVRRDGPRLRVTCQLVSVKDGFHLWSETYDRTMDDAFVIQAEIADGVAEALKAELRAGGPAARKFTRDPEAYRMEVVAKGQMRRMGKAQVMAAQAIYRRLIDMEPRNAEVRAAYAYATALLTQNYLEGDFLPSVRDAEAQIAAALELDPKSSTAYVAQGLVSAIRFIRAGDQAAEGRAEAAYKRAVQLAPRDPEALSLYGDFIASRRPAEAETYLRRALEIDPLDRVANNALAGSLVATGRLGEAEQRYRANIELFPEFVDSKEQLADVLIEQGRLDDGIIWYRMAAEPHSDPSASMQLANLYYNLGLTGEAERALDSWSGHPVVGPLGRAIKMIVADDFEGLLALSQSHLTGPEPDPVWRSGVTLAGAQLGKFDLARAQLMVTSPELFEPAPQVSARLANDAVGAAYVIQQTGDKGQSVRIVQAVLKATEPQPGLRQSNARRIARVKAYAMLGENERALAELRAAIDSGYRLLYDLDVFMRLDEYPMMRGLRDDPRFRAMIREVEADNRGMRQALLDRAPSQAALAGSS